MGKNIKIRLKTIGNREIASRLNEYLLDLDAANFDATEEAMQMVRVYAGEKYAPIDTGQMVETSFTVNCGFDGMNGAEIVYVQPYSAAVEKIETAAHGEAFNIKYAAAISMGFEHPRKPTERSLFLTTAISDKKNEMFNIVKRYAANVTV